MRITSASSAGVAGSPGLTASRTLPTRFAPWPFASGVPVVRWPDSGSGSAHDAYSSGGPCTRSGVSQGGYATTSENRDGVAPCGRAYESVNRAV